MRDYWANIAGWCACWIEADIALLADLDLLIVGATSFILLMRVDSLSGRASSASRAACPHCLECEPMDKNLNADELAWLGKLDTDEPVKPTLPAPLSARLIALGLAIELAEGGLQLTDLGRARLPRR